MRQDQGNGTNPQTPPLPSGLESQLRELVAEVRRSTELHPRQAVLLDVVIDGVRCVLERAQNHVKGLPSLSPREREIAARIADGQINKAIARDLGISEWTVNSHIRRAFQKLGVRSRAEMVAKVLGHRSQG